MMKFEQKPQNAYKKLGTQYNLSTGRVEVKLLEVLNVIPVHVFNVFRNRQILPQPRKIMKETDKLNSNKHCAYHDSIGHNMSDCRDFLR